MSYSEQVKIGGCGSPSEELAEAIGEIYLKRMTTTSGGNISLRETDDLSANDGGGDGSDDAPALWITPAGEDKGRLQGEDMVRVSSDGSHEGKHRPSSEFPIHRSIYQKRPDVMAVIHAHPPALVAYALARKSLDLSVIPYIQRLCGPVGYADYRLPGSEVLGDVIADEFEKGANVVIMENHGVAVAGGSMTEAMRRLHAAEFCAQSILDAATLGGAQVAECVIAEAVDRAEGVRSVKLDENLKIERSSLVDGFCQELAGLVQRACDQGLMTGSYGSVSRRVDSQDYVISPHGMSRPGVEVEDFVLMSGNRQMGNVTMSPSLSWEIHEEIYRTHPDVDSVIITQTPALMAHAVAHQRLDVTTNPESWVFVREVLQLPYDSQISNHGARPAVQALRAECPAVLIDNEAIIVTGGPLMQTFDRLEVSEFTAQSILLAESIGSAVDMEPEKITELHDAFCS